MSLVITNYPPVVAVSLNIPRFEPPGYNHVLLVWIVQAPASTTASSMIDAIVSR
jgi:hypothetical protein